MADWLNRIRDRNSNLRFFEALSRIGACFLFGIMSVACGMLGERSEDKSGTHLASTYEELARLNTNSYDAFGPILQFADSTLFLSYRQASTHVSEDGFTVGRLSTDLGQTWSDPYTIFGDSTQVVRGVAGGVRVSNGDALLFHRRDDRLESIRSPDARTWSRPLSVYQSQDGGNVLAHGDPIFVGGNRLMRGFYTHGASQSAHVTFSDDEGQTWKEPTTVITSNSRAHSFNEASYVYLGENEIIGLVRDNEKEAFTQVRSRSEGKNWMSEGKVPFSYGKGLAHPPLLLRFDNADSKDWIVCLYANRYEQELRMVVTRTDLLRQQGTEAWKKYPIFRLTTFTRRRSGYPAAVQVSSNGKIVGWYYDEKSSSDADIVVFSMNPVQELQNQRAQ